MHHYYLINEINKFHPVKKVFFQTVHEQRTSKWNRAKKMLDPKKMRFAFRRAISTALFMPDIMAQKPFEQKAFFGETSPALDSGIESECVYSFNDPEAVAQVRETVPDLLIVFGTDILKGEILEIAKKNILNIHRDILPKYRGGGLPYWVFYKEDFDNLGVTVHVCAKKLDAGHIVGQKRYKLEKDDRIFTLRYKTTKLAVDILKEVIEKYKNNSVDYVKQEKSKLFTWKKLTIGKEIKARHNLNKYINSLNKSGK